jgi:hypothetical protein
MQPDTKHLQGKFGYNTTSSAPPTVHKCAEGRLQAKAHNPTAQLQPLRSYYNPTAILQPKFRA